MSAWPKAAAAIVPILGAWGFAFFQWGHTPDPPAHSTTAPHEASSADLPTPPGRTRGPTPFGRPLDEDDDDHQADLERIRKLETGRGLGVVKRSVTSPLRDLKESVLGKNGKTRGRDVRNPNRYIPPSYYDYTPREVCIHMKLAYPDQYADLDCDDPSISGQHPWNE